MINRIQKITLLAFFICLGGTYLSHAQDRVPREYTNPDEVVTFDRTTSFKRAIDVINQFAQQYAGKSVIDRTNTDGELGISVPPMHWRDALDLILNAKYLELDEKRNFFEIRRANVAEAGQTQINAAGPDTALTTGSKEVRINAIFFEGNRRALQEVGVDWSTLTQNVPNTIGSFVNQSQGGSGGGGGGGSGGSGGGGGGQQGQLPDVNNFDGPFVSVNSKGAQSVSQNVFNSLINFGDVFGTGISVQALFSAFQADNLGKILTSPSVKVLEGEEGHIQVGQDFSIKQRDFAGNVTDKFFSVGTILNVVPQVIELQDTTFIHLTIEAEKSSAQPDPVSTVINKQNATTQALLLDGESTVIAGLYRTEATEVRRGVPILKDLPAWFFGLRYLFGYNSKDYQTRELVILIQASIEPGIPQRIAQGRLPGKLETLQRERNRMKREIEEYRQKIEQRQEEHKDDTELNNIVPEKSNDEMEPVSENSQDPAEQHPNINRQLTARSIPADKRQAKNADDGSVNAMMSPDDHPYYVVGGSFKNKENAKSMQLILNKEGYNPEILVDVKDGFYMVAYKGFDSQRKALNYLAEIKKDTNTKAWLYNNN